MFLDAMNISSIYKIINYMFYNTQNKVYFISIIIGLLISKIKICMNKYNIKKILKLTPLIIIDIIKTIFIYHILNIIITLILYILISIVRKKIICNNHKVYKILIFIFYFVTPVSINIFDINKDYKEILVLPSIITFIIKMNPVLLLSINTKTIVSALILGLFSYNIINKKQKRNIIKIFLLTLFIIYYYKSS